MDKETIEVATKMANNFKKIVEDDKATFLMMLHFIGAIEQFRALAYTSHEDDCYEILKDAEETIREKLRKMI